MRGFFWLLVITNLSLAGWLYWRAETEQTTVESVVQNPANERLQLLSELPQGALRSIPHVASAPEVPPSAADVTPDSAPGGPTAETGVPDKAQVSACMRISPLAKQTDVEALKKKLLQPKLSVLDSGEGFTERETYWVMIPPYKTAKDARDAATELAKAKVRDFVVVRSGEFENALSLGLFSQKEGAEQRLQELGGLKLNIRRPEIRNRTSSVRSYWLTIRVIGQDTLSALQQQLIAEGLQSTAVDCPQ